MNAKETKKKANKTQKNKNNLETAYIKKSLT